jgi:hypothetical protein
MCGVETSGAVQAGCDSWKSFEQRSDSSRKARSVCRDPTGEKCDAATALRAVPFAKITRTGHGRTVTRPGVHLPARAVDGYDATGHTLTSLQSSHASGA